MDEYDVPLAMAMQYGYYTQMKGFLRNFFSCALRDNTDLALAVLTGCLQTPGLCLFSDLDTVRYCGISESRFADTFGFTDAEVDALLEQAGISEKAPLLKEWYGGYCFGAHSDICCPWDILQYLTDCADNPHQTPKDYWIDTSEDIPLQQILAKNRLPIAGKLRTLARGEPVIANSGVEVSYDKLYASQDSLWSLLHQTGYLTRCPDVRLAEMNKTPQPGQAALMLPNRELRTWLAKSVDNALSEALQQTDQAFFEAFWSSGEEVVSSSLAQLCSRTAGYRDYYDHFHQILVLWLFQAFQYDAVSNTERGLGRSDIIVHHPNRKEAAIMAIGTGREDTPEDLAKLAKLEIDQIQAYLEQYDAQCNKPGARIFCWGMAFAQKECVAKCRLLEC